MAKPSRSDHLPTVCFCKSFKNGMNSLCLPPLLPTSSTSAPSEFSSRCFRQSISFCAQVFMIHLVCELFREFNQMFMILPTMARGGGLRKTCLTAGMAAQSAHRQLVSQRTWMEVGNVTCQLRNAIRTILTRKRRRMIKVIIIKIISTNTQNMQIRVMIICEQDYA